MTDRTCSICGKKHYARDRCYNHYMQWIRSVGGKAPDSTLHPCEADGCERPVRGRYCSKHRRRYERTGDANIKGVRGERHSQWAGDDVTYYGAHARIAGVRGKASQHLCVDCGGTASDWSYRGGSPRERLSDKGKPYSPDPADYDPRCIPCHRKYDSLAS